MQKQIAAYLPCIVKFSLSSVHNTRYMQYMGCLLFPSISISPKFEFAILYLQALLQQYNPVRGKHDFASSIGRCVEFHLGKAIVAGKQILPSGRRCIASRRRDLSEQMLGIQNLGGCGDIHETQDDTRWSRRNAKEGEDTRAPGVQDFLGGRGLQRRFGSSDMQQLEVAGKDLGTSAERIVELCAQHVVVQFFPVDLPRM